MALSERHLRDASRTFSGRTVHLLQLTAPAAKSVPVGPSASPHGIPRLSVFTACRTPLRASFTGLGLLGMKLDNVCEKYLMTSDTEIP